VLGHIIDEAYLLDESSMWLVVVMRRQDD